MATPHISAQPGDFAPAVLMPGDPRRAERIAGQLMPDARKVSDVRGIVGYTGTHEGRPLSVMASGMGQPSLSIYATELYSFYGVERIVRVGTCGGLSPKVAVGDVVIAIDGKTTSQGSALTGYVRQYSANDKVKLTVIRDSKKQDIEVTLAERKDS